MIEVRLHVWVRAASDEDADRIIYAIRTLGVTVLEESRQEDESR